MFLQKYYTMDYKSLAEIPKAFDYRMTYNGLTRWVHHNGYYNNAFVPVFI